jgi:hypothetical protein
MDPHQGSSIALHTSPAGPVKYAWHKTSSICNEKKGMLFSIRTGLASSLEASSGSSEDAECFVYKNNLIGRQFKFIQFYTDVEDRQEV